MDVQMHLAIAILCNLAANPSAEGVSQPDVTIIIAQDGELAFRGKASPLTVKMTPEGGFLNIEGQPVKTDFMGGFGTEKRQILVIKLPELSRTSAKTLFASLDNLKSLTPKGVRVTIYALYEPSK